MGVKQQMERNITMADQVNFYVELPSSLERKAVCAVCGGPATAWDISRDQATDVQCGSCRMVTFPDGASDGAVTVAAATRTGAPDALSFPVYEAVAAELGVTTALEAGVTKPQKPFTHLPVSVEVLSAAVRDGIRAAVAEQRAAFAKSEAVHTVAAQAEAQRRAAAGV